MNFSIQHQAEAWIVTALVLALCLGSFWVTYYCFAKTRKWRLVGFVTPILAMWLAWQVLFVIDPVMSITVQQNSITINYYRSKRTLEQGTVVFVTEVDRSSRYDPHAKGLRFVTRSGAEYETPAIDNDLDELENAVTSSLGLTREPDKDGFRRWTLASSP